MPGRGRQYERPGRGRRRWRRHERPGPGDAGSAGRYTIEATTYEPGETGSFTLTLVRAEAEPPRRRGPGTCETTPLTADGPTDGTWANDCESINQAGSYARYYSFTLAEESEVTITLESTIDTYLYLRAGDAKAGTSENDPPRTTTLAPARTPRSRRRWPPAATPSRPPPTNRGETGSFTLTLAGLSGTAAPPGAGTCETTPLTADGPTDGTWANDCESITSGWQLRPVLQLHPGRGIGGNHHPGVNHRHLPVPAGRRCQVGDVRERPGRGRRRWRRHELPGPGDAGRRPLHHRGHHL